MRKHLLTVIGAAVLATFAAGCRPSKTPAESGPPSGLRGTSSYTPYDAFAMIWAREKKGSMVWVSSGSEAGKLLVSKADSDRRPDWALCSQGVVAGLACRGEKPVILATVYVSDEAVLPVFRKPRVPLAGARSLYIPRSSIELAFDRLLQREGVARDKVRVPKVENVSFTSIVSLLQKPPEESDAIDFGILVDPFISNIVQTDPTKYEVGAGKLYTLCYCLTARQEDIASHRDQFKALLKELLDVSREMEAITNDESFYQEVWGRLKGREPDRLPRLLTYRRQPARLQLDASQLRGLLMEEVAYLTGKYPNELKAPADVNALVDLGLLREVAPDRVSP